MGVLIALVTLIGAAAGLVIGGSIGFVKARKRNANKLLGTLAGMIIGVIFFGVIAFGLVWFLFVLPNAP